MKRVLSAIFALALIASVVSGCLITTAGAASWTWDLSENGTLTISGSGPMDEYWGTSSVGEVPWLDKRDQIVRIEIGSGITSIGGSSFGNCENLKIAVIPSSVTSIGPYAFAYDTKLESVVMVDGVKSISSGAFYGCTALKNVALPDSLTKVANISFCGCTALEKIGLPEKQEVLKKDTFYCDTDCAMTAAYLPASVKEVEPYFFASCPKLKDIYFGGTEAQYKALVEQSGYKEAIASNPEINIDRVNKRLWEATWHYNHTHTWDAGTVVDLATKEHDGHKFIACTECGKAKWETVKYQEEEPTPSDFPNQITAYIDVPEDSWYTTAVYYAESKGYMNGIGGGKFNPTGIVTRGTIAQILYAAEGKPAVSGKSQFTDVGNAKWYADAVKWAADKGLVSGYGNGKFGPDNAVTREQMVAIMYKYSEMKGYDLKASADLSKFADQNQISKYAVNSMKWGADHKIISGTNKGIEPKGNATRAQIAVILQAYDNNVRK